MKRALSIALVLVLVLAAFVACGTKENPSGSPSDSPSDTFAASPGIPSPYTQKWSIANFYCLITGDFWGIVYNGCMKAEMELAIYGINSICIAPIGTGDPTFQIDLIEYALEKGIDGIVLSPMNTNVISTYIANTFTKDYGCPLVMIGWPLNIDSEWVVTHVMADTYAMSQEAGKLAEEAMGGEGLYVLLGISPDNIRWANRSYGAQDYLDENVPGMEMAADIFWGYDVPEEQYIAFVQEQCSAHPHEPIAFLASSKFCTGDVAAALAEIAGEREVEDVIIGYDLSGASYNLIKSGEVYGTVGENPFLIGYNAVYTLIDYLEGVDLPDFVAVPSCVITKNNLESEEVKEYMAMNGISA